MEYEIYFDESNKLDQPKGKYSFYGALGASIDHIENLISKVEYINHKLLSESELHFVDYNKDSLFERYFLVINHVLKCDIKINIMILNKCEANKVANRMNIDLLDLRNLFYVKIPERLFYGLTRDLSGREKIMITKDENSEYFTIDLESKLKEQMNAHSAYRNLGYKVDEVIQKNSKCSIPLQIVDLFIGVIRFLIENQNLKACDYRKSNRLILQSDLIYRILIQENSIEKIKKIVKVYKWGFSKEQIMELNINDFIGNFLINKFKFDTAEMTKFQHLMYKYPNQDTKFYREKMNYSNDQLITLLSYKDEIEGRGRNYFFLKKWCNDIF